MSELVDKKIWIELFESRLPVEEATLFLHHPNCGGICTFLGTTRAVTDRLRTKSLSYEAYHAMALAEMQRIAEIALERWPIEKVCVIHRLGVVAPSEASVFVGVATPHRNEAFEASRFLIDTLKISVPIWKKELYTDGREDWVEGNFPEAEEGD